jgi:amino acid adenylation domain-containing protein
MPIRTDQTGAGRKMNVISAGEILLNAVEKKENEIAVRDSERSLSYKELLDRAFALSQKINRILGGKNNRVLIISKKSIDSVLAIWGVVCSGNCYVAVDCKTPETRLHKIVDTIEPKLILYTDQDQTKLESTGIPYIVLEDETVRHVDSQFVRKTLKEKHIIDADPLYMVFTSGSTGEPKAIVKSHRSVLTFAQAFVMTFDLDETGHEIFGNQASFDFDVSAKDIYISAFIGATLCIIPGNCFLVPGRLADFLRKNEVTILIWAASAVKYVRRFDCFKRVKPESIRKVFFSGESMPGECISYWKKSLPKAVFVNLYAPSEVTGNCLYHIADEEAVEGILPLDSKFPNIDVMVIKDNGELANDGEKGQIYVRGSFVAQGYLGDQKKTKTCFIQNPLNNDFTDPVYKTGDYVLKKGKELYFIGRIDNQIKHMGHRIELEEIESYCYAATNCSSFCAIYDFDREKIIIMTDEKNITYKELVSKLKLVVPKYMIPHELLVVDELPHNDRGKIDRAKTKKIYEVMKNA